MAATLKDLYDAYNAGASRATLVRLINDLEQSNIQIPPDLRREIHELADIDDDEEDAGTAAAVREAVEGVLEDLVRGPGRVLSRRAFRAHSRERLRGVRVVQAALRRHARRVRAAGRGGLRWPGRRYPLVPRTRALRARRSRILSHAHGHRWRWEP